MSSDISLLVVGGGPAGVTAALQACEPTQVDGYGERAVVSLVPIRVSAPRCGRWRVMDPKRVPYPGASKAITLLMPVGLPRIRSGACAGG